MFLWGKYNLIYGPGTKEDLDKDIQDLMNSMDDMTPVSVRFEVGYWRKANHIHNFFSNALSEFDDKTGDETWVPINVLEMLRERCVKVLEARDEEISSELLPTMDGFFFGSTDYDDYYYDQVKETIIIIDKALKYKNKMEYYYAASW